LTDGCKFPKEGELYKRITVGGHCFELRYGYYEHSDRPFSDPVVIFPDLETSPLHADNGHRIVTCVQNPCTHYRPRNPAEPEHWCADCIHYPHPPEEISLCLRPVP